MFKSVITGGAFLLCGTILLCAAHQVPVPTSSSAPQPVIEKTGPNYGAFLAGRLAQSNQDFEVSARYYGDVLKADNKNAKVLNTVFFTKMLQGDWDSLIPLLDSQQAKENTLLNFMLVAQNIKTQHGADNTPLLAQINETDPLIGALMTAWHHASLRHPEQAIEALKILKQNKKWAFLYDYHSGLINALTQNNAAADKAFQRLGKTDFPSWRGFRTMQDFYIAQNKWNDQNPLYQKYQQQLAQQETVQDVLTNKNFAPPVMNATQGMAEGLYNASIALAANHLVDSALFFNALALYLDPDVVVYKIWAAELLETIGAYRLANKTYDAIGALNETLLFKKALNCLLLKQENQAEVILKDIYTKNQHLPLVILTLANLYRDTNRPDVALPFYTKALALYTDQQVKEKADTYFARAVAYEKLKQLNKAQTDLQNALRLTPNSPMILNYLGYLWLDDKQHLNEAQQMILQAHHLAPNDPYILDSVAWGYYRQGDFEKALVYAEQATDMLPASALVNSHLGDIYAALGRRRESQYQYHKALALKNDLTDELKAELNQKVANHD